MEAENEDMMLSIKNMKENNKEIKQERAELMEKLEGLNKKLLESGGAAKNVDLSLAGQSEGEKKLAQEVKKLSLELAMAN